MATRKSTTSKSRSKRSAKAEPNGIIESVSPAMNGGAAVENANGVSEPLLNADQIRFRAYQIFVARGGAHGDDWNDWFAAERELSASKAP